MGTITVTCGDSKPGPHR